MGDRLFDDERLRRFVFGAELEQDLELRERVTRLRCGDGEFREPRSEPAESM